MKYTQEQLRLARENSHLKSDCPEWMQHLFENAPKGKLYWKRTRTTGWKVSVGETWPGGIYRIAENYEGD